MEMSLAHTLLLAVIQGFTEFLPISSSGFLFLGSYFFFDQQGSFLIDIAVHIGTLLAVVWALRQRLISIVHGLCWGDREAMRLILLLAIGTAPLLIIGFALYTTGAYALVRTFEVVAWMTVLFGLFLLLSDKRKEEKSGVPSATGMFFTGCAQALAVVPGVSRSGVVMTAMRAYSYTRKDAIDVALLLGIPAILISSGPLWLSFSEQTLHLPSTLIAVLVSFLVALFSIEFLRRVAARFTFAPFAVFRIVFGIFLLFVIYI